MKKLTVVLCVLLAASTAGYASEKSASPTELVGDIKAGEAKSATCKACHGADGNSAMAIFPKIAGQGEKYLIRQLHDFKSGVRKNAQMSPMAAPLNDQDIVNLAAYYATQKTQRGAASPELVAQGEQIYRGGNKRGLPACIGCHGPKGSGNEAAAYPKLSGQHADYTVKQLQDYRSGERGADPSDPRKLMMRTIAAKMTDAEMKAVADYISGLH